MTTKMIDYSASETDDRLKYLDDARRFFIQIWRENPDLLKNGEPRLIELMTPIWEQDERERARKR